MTNLLLNGSFETPTVTDYFGLGEYNGLSTADFGGSSFHSLPGNPPNEWPDTTWYYPDYLTDAICGLPLGFNMHCHTANAVCGIARASAPFAGALTPTDGLQFAFLISNGWFVHVYNLSVAGFITVNYDYALLGWYGASPDPFGVYFPNFYTSDAPIIESADLYHWHHFSSESIPVGTGCRSEYIFGPSNVSAALGGLSPPIGAYDNFTVDFHIAEVAMKLIDSDSGVGRFRTRYGGAIKLDKT